MTNTRHKPVAARASRKSRYRDAVQPIKEAFGCTAMEAVDHVRITLAENARLRKEVMELDQEKQKLLVELDQLTVKTELDQQRLKLAEDQVSTLEEEKVDLKRLLDALDSSESEAGQIVEEEVTEELA